MDGAERSILQRQRRLEQQRWMESKFSPQTRIVFVFLLRFISRYSDRLISQDISLCKSGINLVNRFFNWEGKKKAIFTAIVSGDLIALKVKWFFPSSVPSYGKLWYSNNGSDSGVESECENSFFWYSKPVSHANSVRRQKSFASSSACESMRRKLFTPFLPWRQSRCCFSWSCW